MTPPSMADAVAAVENACRSARSAPRREPERRHRADEPAAVVREVAAALQTAFRFHRLAVPDQTPYGIVAVTGHAGPGVPRAAFATVDAVAPFEAESSWTGVLADACPDVGWLFLVCADFGRMRGPRAGAVYPELLAGAGALAHALRLAVSCPRRGTRIHTGSHRPVTSAVRRPHPGMRHLVTVSAGPLDGSPT
ncbi:hypothetical protein E0500_020765 [Streptomyces sp. KM273126]|uniref:hypothetical protein n=1 Tax=Streptomyces sp. KM273126 TaxID=2545247 RepID=UPI001404D072|nr:hypothetical protein [Streptomyces sp. KM273126]MBA2809764.1 hypothetical protein [Streptomyces sp. KM273126]